MDAAVCSMLTLVTGNKPKFSEGSGFARPIVIVY